MVNNKEIFRSKPLQMQFLDKIKSLIPPGKSHVDEIADLLEISSDSVYRRFRGETSLTLEDILRLCEYFKVDFDFKSHNTNLVLFRYNYLYNLEDFESYLNDLYDKTHSLSETTEREIVFIAIDVPMFHHFDHPVLAAFKIFFWLRNIVNDDGFGHQRFNNEIIDKRLLDKGKEIYNAYCKIPSTEIWTYNTASSLISQIDLAWSSGLFDSREIALQVCNEALEEIQNIQKQCSQGFKEIHAGDDSAPHGNFTLYLSDMEVSNNCLYVNRADNKEVYLGFQTFNNIATIDQNFCDETSKWIKNLVTKSVLISGAGEKQRYAFFKNIMDDIEVLIKKISSD